MSQSPPRRPRRFQYTSSESMEVPRLSLDALSLARALAAAAAATLAQLRARPRVETAVKCSGGVAAALLALKFAKSLRAACAVGLLAGVFAHSLYADVLRKKPAIAQPHPTLTVATAARRRSRVDRDEEKEPKEEDEKDDEHDAAPRVQAVVDKPRVQMAVRARDH